MIRPMKVVTPVARDDIDATESVVERVFSHEFALSTSRMAEQVYPSARLEVDQ